MRSIAGQLVALAVAGAMGAGCNAILGNDVHELDPNAMPAQTATGSAGSSGRGSSGSAGSTGPGSSGSGGSMVGSGSGGTSVTTDASTGDVTEIVSETGSVGRDVVIGCVPGAMQCMNNAPQTCDRSGNWQTGAPCASVCSQGVCTGSCVPKSVQTCGGAATCNAGAMQTCDATGTWGDCTPAPSTCTSVPVGWQPVAITHATCPDGFGSPQTYLTSATGAAFTCSCSCSGTQHCAGSVTLNQFGGDAGASCGSTPTTRTFGVTPNCQSGNYGNILMGYSYTISGVAYAPAPACTATPTPTTQPAVVTESVTLCTPSLVCTGGACLSASQAMNMCVSQAGTKTCPADYPTRTIMAPSFDDTRGCGACACGSTLTCDLTGVVLNNDAACSTGHPYEMTGTTSCAAAPSNYPLNAVQAVDATTGDGTCAMTSPSGPTGAVALHDTTTVTVCCK